MARDNYNEVVKTINQSIDLGLKSYHRLQKNLPVVEPISCEYNPDEPSVSLLGRAINSKVRDDMATNNLLDEINAAHTEQEEPDNSKVKFDGAKVPLYDCINYC